MRKLSMFALLSLFVLGLYAQPAFAVKAFSDNFIENYKGSSIAEAAAETKCNVCHYGKSKKNRNDYGTSLNKLGATKDLYTELKADKDKLAATLKGIYAKAEAEKSVSGKTFGEMIKAGKLPGTAPAE